MASTIGLGVNVDGAATAADRHGDVRGRRGRLPGSPGAAGRGGRSASRLHDRVDLDLPAGERRVGDERDTRTPGQVVGVDARERERGVGEPGREAVRAARCEATSSRSAGCRRTR